MRQSWDEWRRKWKSEMCECHILLNFILIDMPAFVLKENCILHFHVLPSNDLHSHENKHHLSQLSSSPRLDQKHSPEGKKKRKNKKIPTWKTLRYMKHRGLSDNNNVLNNLPNEHRCLWGDVKLSFSRWCRPQACFEKNFLRNVMRDEKNSKRSLLFFVS